MNLFASEIFRNALLAGTVVALITALAGYFLVLRAQAFAGEALKDIGFAGATGAVLIGLNSIFGMLGFSLLAAIALGFLTDRMRGRDIETGMVLSFALGLGVLFLSVWSHSSAAHASSGMTILFGSVLGIERSDLLVAVGSSLLAAAMLATVFRPLLFASVDPTLAEARGVPVRGLSMVFMIVLAITVASSILIVGVLLVGALLIAPAAAALNLARSPAQAVVVAMVIGLAATWTGLALAFSPVLGYLPVGFTISTLASLIYFISWLIRRRGEARVRIVPIHPSREVAPPGTWPGRGAF